MRITACAWCARKARVFDDSNTDLVACCQSRECARESRALDAERDELRDAWIRRAREARRAVA